MMRWISAALLVSTLAVAGAGRIESAAATTLRADQKSQASDVSHKPTDVSAHRHYHHYRHYHRYYGYGYRRYYRPYYPAYYARPYYYAPYPYYAPAPFPFGFSIGFGTWW